LAPAQRKPVRLPLTGSRVAGAALTLDLRS